MVDKMDESTKARDTVACPNCQARVCEPCTTPTTSGRKNVFWLHDARWDAYRETD